MELCASAKLDVWLQEQRPEIEAAGAHLWVRGGRSVFQSFDPQGQPSTDMAVVFDLPADNVVVYVAPEELADFDALRKRLMGELQGKGK